MKEDSTRVILGSLVGGIILFGWSAFSWTVLPWHNATFEKFTQEYVVEVVLASNAPKKGIYLVPAPHKGTQEEQQKAHEKMEKGSFAFVVMNPKGWGPMPPHLLIGLLTQILGAGLVTGLLRMTAKLGYWEKVGFTLVFAVAAGVVCHLPNWNWWGFSEGFTLLAFADLLIGWFLAGLALSKIA